jgi:hypothetical protein
MAFSIADITGLLGVGGKKRPSASTSAAADSGQVRSGRLSVDGPPLYRAGDSFLFDTFSPPNLLSVRYLAIKNAHKRPDYVAVVLSLIVSVALLAYTAYQAYDIHDRAAQVDELETQVAQVMASKDQVTKELATSQSSVYLAQRFLLFPSKRFLVSSYLADLSAAVNPHVYVSRVALKFSTKAYYGKGEVPLQSYSTLSSTSSTRSTTGVLVERLDYTVQSKLTVQAVDGTVSSADMNQIADRFHPPATVDSTSGSVTDGGLSADMTYTYLAELHFSPPAKKSAMKPGLSQLSPLSTQAPSSPMSANSN